MRRTLLITNDFPPRTGGIQSYVHELASRLPADDLVVYASSWEGDREFDAAQRFPVIRHSSSLMVPTPGVLRRAAALIAEHRLSAVWFGAAAPLALMTGRLRARGIERVVASTHGHEVGWSMAPVTRQSLRMIGNRVDVVTYVSEYARSRVASAFGPEAAMEYLPAGVDTSLFRPDPIARQRIRDRHSIADRPVLTCVSRLVPRKGQDTLIRALPRIAERVPDVLLVLVGGGRFGDRLQELAVEVGVADTVLLTGSVAFEDLPAYYSAADVFAMPCRTRGGGLDVEGLGIVYLEASSAGLPVVAGDSGGAPEAVQPGRTGLVVDGRDVEAVAEACVSLLQDPDRSARWGRAGRDWVATRWNWDHSARRLAELLTG